MAFEVVSFVRGMHVIFASLWVGAAVFMAFVLGPHMASPAGGAFMRGLLGRGGSIAWFFPATGILTILTGAYVYNEMGYAADPFGGGARASVTIGAILALLALVHGAASLGPAQKRMKRIIDTIPANAPPTPEQAAELQRLGMKQGKGGAASAALIFVALLAMSLRVLF